MTKAVVLSERLQKIKDNLQYFLAMMPCPQTDVEREHLLAKCIDNEQLDLSEEERSSLLGSLQEGLEIGSLIHTESEPLHRPLSVPNEKYPCVSDHSENMVWDAFNTLRPAILDLLEADHTGKMNKEQLTIFMEDHIKILLEKFNLKLNEREIFLVNAIIIDDIFGLGPLEQLIADPAVSDVLVNGHDKVYIERNGILKKCLVSFRNNDHLIQVIRRVVSRVGRRIDMSSPYVDARLADGSRVNAIIPPLAIDAPSLSIRRFGKRRIFLDYMVKADSMSLKMASFLSLAVKSKLNIIVSGGTGSGKTTLLNAMSWAINVNDRIVTIEDSAELRLDQPHVVRLETRKANTEGRGEVKEQSLVKNSLRMRPDRIIVGEVRGAEAFDMIQAMNTGHTGSMCTIHANNPDEVAARLCNMVSMSEAEHSEDVTLQQLSQVLHVIVQVSRMRDGKRRVVNISEVTGKINNHMLELNTLFSFDYNKSSASKEISGKFIQNHGVVPSRCLKESISSGLYEQMATLFAEKKHD